MCRCLGRSTPIGGFVRSQPVHQCKQHTRNDEGQVQEHAPHDLVVLIGTDIEKCFKQIYTGYGNNGSHQLDLAFAVLALGHIASIFLFWGWK